MARILIVDDSAFARSRLAQVLRKAGHQVAEADGGAAALALMEEFRPDLVTVDLLMPEMDGMELIGRLKERWPQIPVVAVSADVQRSSQEEALAAGALAFFSKTGRPEELLDLIKTIKEESPSRLLSLMQQDAFTEIINLAMGQAAAALSSLMDKPVRLKVPQMEVMEVEALEGYLDGMIPAVGAVILQRFSGALNGSGSLVLPQDHALTLVRLLLGTQKDLGRLSSAEQTVLAEVGNIVLNSALAVLGDRMEGRLNISLPLVFLTLNSRSLTEMILRQTKDSEQAIVLLSRLTIGHIDLLCYLILVLPRKQLQVLLYKMGLE